MGSAAPAIFSVATLAAHWNCGTDTIYSMIRSGDLPAFKVGGRLLRIRREEVEKHECPTTTDYSDTATSSPSSGTKTDDATVIRLERLIELPQRPQLVHSGNDAR